MIGESVVIGMIGGLGISVLGFARVRSVPQLGVLALPIGAAAMSMLGLLLAAVGLAPSTGVLLALSVLGAILLPLTPGAQHPPLWKMAMVIGGLVVGAALLYPLGLVTLTPDSFRYLSVGPVLGKIGMMAVPPDILLERGLVLPMVHSTGEALYLRAFTPLVALSTLGVLAWASFKALGETARTRSGILLIGGAAALLLTNHRFVFNSFYVNGHMLFAVWLLVSISIPWLIEVGRVDERMLGIVAVVLPALSVLRPEAALYAPLVLVGILGARAISTRWKSRLLILVGVTTLMWQLVILRSFLLRGETPVKVVLLVGLGALMVVTGLTWRRLEPRLSGLLVPIALVALMLALAVFAMIEGEIFMSSLEATIQNLVLGKGLYGISILVLVALLTAGIWRGMPARRMLAFPLVTAAPFLFLMAHLRSESGGAYRVGPGDSLNRMLLHWIPLAAFYLVAMAADLPSTVPPTTSDEARGELTAA